MDDVSNEHQDLSPARSNLNPPSPSPPSNPSSHSADRAENLDELFNICLDRQSSNAVVINLDTDSDFSDDEGDDRPSHRQEPGSSPDTTVRNGGQNESKQTCGLFQSLTRPHSPQIIAGGNPSINAPKCRLFTVKFGGRAGEAVEGDLECRGYTQYSRDLQTEDTPSEWAPFSTCMEWELARWAKLRGPSLTAFLELLKIDGVCRSFISSLAVVLNTISSHSLPTHLACHSRVLMNSTISSTKSFQMAFQNLFGTRLRLQVKLMSFIIVTSSSVYVSYMATPKLQSFLLMHQRNISLVEIRRLVSILRCIVGNGGGPAKYVFRYSVRNLYI